MSPCADESLPATREDGAYVKGDHDPVESRLRSRSALDTARSQHDAAAYAVPIHPDHDTGADHDHDEDHPHPLLSEPHTSPLRRCLASMAIMAFVIVLTVGASLYWRTGRGPVPLPFLTDHVLRAMAARLPPGY